MGDMGYHQKNNIGIIGLPKGEEKKKGRESLFEEIMAGNFPNIGRDLNIQVDEANRSPQNFN